MGIVGRAVLALVLMLTTGVSAAPDRSVRPVRPAPRRAASARISAEECSRLALKASIAKARAEMSTVAPGAARDLAAFGKAMDSDRRLAARVKRAFGNADIIKSEYTRGRDCVVTVKLPLDRLQNLTAGL